MIEYETMMAISMFAIMAFVFTDGINSIRSSEDGYMGDLIWVGLVTSVAGVSMIGWATYIVTG